MKITEDHRTVYEFVAQFGPITTKDLAQRCQMSSSAAAGKLATLVHRGHVVDGGWVEPVGSSGKWVRQWKRGAVPLPPRTRSLAAVPDLEDEPPARGKALSPEALDQRTTLRTKLYERACEEGLNPTTDPAQDWRVSVPHPLGQPGRVWVDTPGDLDLVLIDLGREVVKVGPKQGPDPFWLPAAPLAAWALGTGRAFNDIAQGDEAMSRCLNRIKAGEQHTLRLSWAERFAEHVGVPVEVIWPDVEGALEQGRYLRTLAGREELRVAA